MKIGIVNDVPMAVEALRRALALEAKHQVIWVARDGAEAVAFSGSSRPDLVLMDLLMPTMDGVEATRRIMTTAPCPILIVTFSVGANSSRVYEAMGYGALDAVDTPSLGVGDLRAKAAPLLAKIDAIEKLCADETVRARFTPGSTAQIPAAPNEAIRGARAARQLIAIGASAGGPVAVLEVLSALPKTLDAAVVVVQHVDEQFANGMAVWLGESSALPVRVAREGDQPVAGVVLLAATADHLIMTRPDRLGYTRAPVDYAYRPSVDVFFRSVGRLWTGSAVGVLLTGMGRDGALGLKEMREKGHHTIAQDEESSAVYGMPKAAAAIDAAVEILPLDRIAPGIVRALQRTLREP